MPVSVLSRNLWLEGNAANIGSSTGLAPEIPVRFSGTERVKTTSLVLRRKPWKIFSAAPSRECSMERNVRISLGMIGEKAAELEALIARRPAAPGD